MRLVNADELRKKAVPHTRGSYGFSADIRKWAVLVGDIDDTPTIDPIKHGYVPTEVLKQIQWERDIAMSYLEEAGIGFGEKAEIKRVVHGHWIEDTVGCANPFDPYKEDYMDVIICSECGTYYDTSNRTNYCSNCGTQMDGEADE